MQPAKYLEVLDINNRRVAFLSPASDGIKNAKLSKEKNGLVTLKFILPRSSEKWMFVDGLHKVKVNGHIFWISGTEEERDKQGKLLSNVQCEEIWVRDLGRQRLNYLIVEILSSTASNALSTLLAGSGWSVGQVTVTGVHDLESEKQSLLWNLWKARETWGGVLVFDSVNKTVSLLDDTDWGEDNKVAIRYGKNQKSIKRKVDYEVVTRLIPLGLDGLTIASVNDGKLYIDNNQYTDQIIEDTWENQEHNDPAELKAAAEKALESLSRPRVTYTINVVDLSSKMEYEQDAFDLGHWLTIIDPEISPNGTKIQIYKYEYDVFEPWRDVFVELGDPLEDFFKMIADHERATQTVNYSIRPNPSFNQLLKGKLNTFYTQINGASGDAETVDGVTTYIGRDGQGIDNGLRVRISPAGIGFSTDYGQSYTTALTGEGIAAEAVTTGVLNAGRIQVGAGTTFEAGYNPSAKNANYVQDTDPSVNWTGIENIYHINDTWYSQAEQKTRIFKNSDAYFFNLGVGGGSVINGYAGSSLSTLGRPVPISYFGIKGATSGIGNLYLWKLDSAFKFVELVATGNAVYEDGGANYHCELMLEANTNYAIIASVTEGNISKINGSSAISNDWVTGVLDKNYVGISAPTAGAELTATMEHEIRLGIYGWIDVEDANLTNFIKETYASDISNIGTRIDAKAEFYSQTTMPHPEYTNVADNQIYNTYVGDLWYNNTPSSKQTYIYTKTANGSNYDYKWLEKEIPTAVFNTIDGKRTVFTSIPTTPYYKGDLWLTSIDAGTGDLKKCIHERLTGDYVPEDWVLATKYTDDTAANTKNTTFSTCPNNGKYKKNDIMIPSVGFVSGAKTFYAGEIYQALADGDGTAFNSAHWAEASLLSSWKKTGTTTIDGGQIAADTIEAVSLKSNTAMVNYLNALNITAKYVSANGVTAGTINSDNVNVKSNDGNLNIANAEIIIKHNNGTKSKLNHSGLKLYESLAEIPYVTPIDGGNVTANTSPGWSGSNGNGYSPSMFTVQKRGKLWVGKAAKTVCIPTIGEAIRWRDPDVYRDNGVTEAACQVYSITDVATTTDRTSTLPDQTGMAANQIKLDSGASTTDDYYNGKWINIDGVSRKISDYTGSTRVAMVEESFETSNLPQSGDTYTIETIGGVDVVIESWKRFLTVDGSSGYYYCWRLAFNYLVILKG